MNSDLARIGHAIGAPARAAIINALFDGTTHTAGDLARAARVTPGTASQHLRVLTEAGVVTVHVDGRYRCYRLASTRIAHALEQLAGPDLAPVTSYRLSREQLRVRAARTCYDHLAGQLGVNLTHRFYDARWITPDADTLTETGRRALQTHFAIHPHQLDTAGPDRTTRSRRPLVRRCTDWTERQDHIAGRLGALIANRALADGWVERVPGSRALRITQHGREQFTDAGIRTP